MSVILFNLLFLISMLELWMLQGVNCVYLVLQDFVYMFIIRKSLLEKFSQLKFVN